MKTFHSIIGLASPALGITISLSQVESWLRITSLVVGIAVGVASFIAIVTHKKKLPKPIRHYLKPNDSTR